MAGNERRKDENAAAGEAGSLDRRGFLKGSALGLGAHVSTFSPYCATLRDSERGFFDVNYLSGEGNAFSLDLDFGTRFAG